MAAPHGRTNLVIPPMLWTQGNECREKERERERNKGCNNVI